MIICILAKPVSIFLTEAYKTSATQECKKKRSFSCIAKQNEQRFIKFVRKMKIVIHVAVSLHCAASMWSTSLTAVGRLYRETSKDS